MAVSHIVKRKGHKEKFDEKKLYGSVYGACMVSDMGEGKCEEVAGFVTKTVKNKLKKKKEVDSTEISKLAEASLRKKNKEAAFMYKTHRDIS